MTVRLDVNIIVDPVSVVTSGEAVAVAVAEVVEDQRRSKNENASQGWWDIGGLTMTVGLCVDITVGELSTPE